MKAMFVESPAKINAIKKILNAINDTKWDVFATRGYIKDLPKNATALAFGNDSGEFKAKWEFIGDKKKEIDKFKKTIKNYSEIYISTDDDTEGEKIAYDLVDVLGIWNSYKRVVFNAITKKEILKGLDNPRSVDESKYKVACSRRYIDRDEGYGITEVMKYYFTKEGLQFPNNIAVGSSISPSLHLIAEAKREINQFAVEFFTRIHFTFQTKKGDVFKFLHPTRFINNNKSDQIALQLFRRQINKRTYIVKDYIPKLEDVSPPEPLYTASLQSGAFYAYGYSAKKTMSLSQDLFSNGAITYHRTDSNQMSDDAFEEIIDYLYDKYSADEIYAEKRKYKKRENIEASHECIRASVISNETEPQLIKEYIDKKYNFYLTNEHINIYTLIWYRTIATQMDDAVYDRSVLLLDVPESDIELKITANEMLNKKGAAGASGWMTINIGDILQKSTRKEGEEFKTEAIKIPRIDSLEKVYVTDISDYNSKTKAPHKYGEGRFITTIEKLGIARPSSLANIIPSLYEKKLISVIRGVIDTTALGMIVDEWVEEYCAWLNDIEEIAEFKKALEVVGNSKDELGLLYKYHEKIAELKSEIGYKEKEEIVTKPTKKQIDFAKELALTKKMKLSEDMLSDKNLLSKFISENFTGKSDHYGVCPECHKGKIYENSKAFGCSKYKDGCKFSIWKESTIKILSKFSISADEKYIGDIIRLSIEKTPIEVENNKDSNSIFVLNIIKNSKGWGINIEKAPKST